MTWLFSSLVVKQLKIKDWRHFRVGLFKLTQDRLEIILIFRFKATCNIKRISPYQAAKNIVMQKKKNNPEWTGFVLSVNVTFKKCFISAKNILLQRQQVLSKFYQWQICGFIVRPTILRSMNLHLRSKDSKRERFYQLYSMTSSLNHFNLVIRGFGSSPSSWSLAASFRRPWPSMKVWVRVISLITSISSLIWAMGRIIDSSSFWEKKEHFLNLKNLDYKKLYLSIWMLTLNSYLRKCWFINNSQRVIALNENFTLLLKFLFCNVTAF